jgi:hypothetical protein
MQSNVNNNSTLNVISLTRKTQEKKSDTTDVENSAEPTFEEIMRRNMENRDRMARERAKANQSVIKSYRLKK